MLVRKNDRRIARAAFTLMEMMVVVAIIVVLGGIAVLAYSNFADKGNEAKALATVKQIDMALFDYVNEHKTYPPDLVFLAQPDAFGKTRLSAEALTPPWPGTKYDWDPQGRRNLEVNGEYKPDVFIIHPSGNYMWGNWASGKQPVGN